MAVIKSQMLSLLLCYVFLTVTARKWTDEYTDALIKGRDCLGSEYTALLDSFIQPLNETSERRYFSARIISLLLHRLDRNEPLCRAIVETASHLYHELHWQKRQEARRISRKKAGITAALHVDRDTAIDMLQYRLTNNRIRSTCESFATLTMEERARVYKCMRSVRKDSVWAYTKYTE